MSNLSINVRSTVDKNLKPLVVIDYDGNFDPMTPIEAKNRAISIILACSQSKTEAKIINLLRPKHKGFGEMKEKDRRFLGAAIGMVRGARESTDDCVNAIYGLKTDKPLIDYIVMGTSKIQLELPEALHHAQCLLEAAEAAETDSFVYQFFEDSDLSKDDAAQLLKYFETHRQRLRLDSLLKSS